VPWPALSGDGAGPTWLVAVAQSKHLSTSSKAVPVLRKIRSRHVPNVFGVIVNLRNVIGNHWTSAYQNLRIFCLSTFVNRASVTNIFELYVLSSNPGQENEVDVGHEFPPLSTE
jgi:hypothetical protein